MDIEALKPQISQIARKYGLDFVVLFGSQATGRIHAKSDVDIAVISKQSFDKLKVMDDFWKLFKREDVEVVNLAMASPTLMRAVVVDGKVLYEREKTMYLRWKFYAIRTWMETAWLREFGRQKMIEWAKQS